MFVQVDATTSCSSQECAKCLPVASSSKGKKIRSTPSEGSSVSIIGRKIAKTNVVCLQHATVEDGNNDNDAIKAAIVVDKTGNNIGDETRRHDIQLSSEDSSSDENATFSNFAWESNRFVDETEANGYERIELASCREDISDIPSSYQTSNQFHVNDADQVAVLCTRNVFAKTGSTNDLTTKSFSETRLDEERRLIEILAEQLLLDNERGHNCDKKKTHFTKNVLHFVPEYLVKRSKRRKKKTGTLSSSLNSLKTSSLDTKGVGVMANTSYRSRSLSTEASKYLNISSPTNFVHVASATSPNLILNENTIKLNLEQAVITHEQKCATLPLLVARREIFFPEVPSLSFPVPRRNDESKETARSKDETFKHELLSELRARSAKRLEQSQQQVKTSENLVYMCDGSNSSCSKATFVSSNRIKHHSENISHQPLLPPSTLNENIENVGKDQYDDVGPLNITTQEDDYDNDYDDVGTPIVNIDENSTSVPTCKDSDSIYDDVMAPTFPTNSFELKNATVNDSGEIVQEDESIQKNDNYHLFVSNDYSSVNDEDTADEAEDKDQGVYDDVGLAGEERVNSLYAGSTADSNLATIWMNGTESESEDFEHSTTGLPRLVNMNNSSAKSIEIQMISTRKKSGQGCTRKGRRQPSRSPRSISSKLSNGTTHDSSTHDNALDDSTYESLQSFQQDNFSTDSETETSHAIRSNENIERDEKMANRLVITYLEAPTRPTPPPPREISLTRTLGRRIKMLRRTWSITKGSLGRMRRRTSIGDNHICEESRELPCNDQSHLDNGRYFGFAKHFKKSITGFSTFYLNGYTANGSNDLMKSSDGRSSVDKQPIYNEETDHYSVLTEKEPLYQFYAAAAARVAFDSNSDGYEEIQVENTIPSQSTTELAKPGHRTLWCQTSQVINSDLLQRLTVEERKIQEAKFEILTSEASYLNSLRVLRNEFLNDCSINKMLTPLEKDKLFGGIPSVLRASEQCLAELEAIWRQDPMLHGLPNVLLKYADKYLDIYVAYCSNQVSIDSTLKDLRTRKGLEFLQIVSQIEARSTCQSLSLHSFLMLPMQRITRLPLLADAVLSKLSLEHIDRPVWERVLSTLSYVVAECNEGARAAAKEAEIESLARKLEYSAKIKPIVLKGKHLVKTGPVVQLSSRADAEYKLTFGKRFNKTHLYLLLLTDYLLVAKYKSNTQDAMYTVIDTCKRSLIALEPVPDDSPFSGRNAMLLTLLENYSGHPVEYILTCESDTERQRWLEAVSPSKRDFMEETLYEVWDCPQVVALYCYSPNQPDELSLHPGDVINVFRKMSDGWYHGEKLLDGEQGWFPGNYTKEVASEHVRAKNLKQRHRLLALNDNMLQRKTKRQSAVS